MPSEVEILSFEPVDAVNFNFRDKNEARNILRINPQYFQLLPTVCDGNVYSINRNGKIIIIIGWTSDAYYGSATMFFFACENLEKEFDGNVLRALRKILNFAKLSHKRVQSTCSENKRNKRFLEFMGFKQECLMKKAGFDCTDLYLYSIVQ